MNATQSLRAHDGWLLVGVPLGAASATVAGTLPGQSFWPLGAAAQALIWGAMYLGLARLYGPSRRGEASPPGVSRRLGVSLLLALGSTHFVRLILSDPVWFHLYYLRLLVPVTLIVIWCSVLLREPTGRRFRSAMSSPGLAIWTSLALLLAAAVILVCGADLVFERAAASITAVSERTIRQSALVTNVVLLFSAYTVTLGLISRTTAAALLVSPVYVLLGTATLMKMKYLNSALQPLDFLRLQEFTPLMPGFLTLPVVLLACGVAAAWCLALVVAYRCEPVRLSGKRRWLIGTAALALFLAIPTALALAPGSPPAASLVRRMGAPDGHWKDRTRTSGFLLSFLADLPAAFVTPPADYSSEAVAGAFRRRLPVPGRAAPLPAARGRVNLVVYLVESLMDPYELGLRYTSDPIRNLRALGAEGIAGHAFVPEEFQGSANTEFELLTGMTKSFLPAGSVPYRQHVRAPIPSLARTLREAGYLTTVIQPDPRNWYNREQVYPLLGFERIIWLDETPGIDRDSRVDWPTDQAVVEAVIAASSGPRPFFVFAFPSSTHSPYHTGRHVPSRLDVINPDPYDRRGEVKEYVNAVRRADQAIAALVNHFRRRPDPTVIAILGDHLPPLSEGARRSFTQRVSRASPAQQERMLTRVPLLIWANFPLPPERQELSVNALPSLLLEELGITPGGFLAVTGAVGRTLPVLGRYVTGSDGRVWRRDSLPEDLQVLLHDYELLQYDLLLGKRYSMREGFTGFLSRGSTQR